VKPRSARLRESLAPPDGSRQAVPPFAAKSARNSRKAELTVAEGRAIPPEKRQQARIVHERGCRTDCGRVFKCRAPGGRFTCGRYVGACSGGDDNRCAACANNAWADLKSRLVAFVETALTHRGEIAICKRFSGYDSDARVEDALYELVRESRLEWFGSSEHPLKYRVARRAA
jgi:hypothetical protein